jgi:prevent-host-death family protein
MRARIGIRELKQNASAIVKRAAAGETLHVTDRGRPVARIGPIERGGAYDRLIADGRIAPARGSLLDEEPMAPASGRPSGSEALAGLRAGER